MIIATHDGPFHADDVFGCALLLELFPDAILLRSRDPSELDKADIVFDVGGVQDPTLRRFDHHMLKADRRRNGIIYSAFGLLWREYGLEFCDMNTDAWLKIDYDLVESIDADDNGQITESSNEFKVARTKIDDIVRMFNPVDEETFDEQFMIVVSIVRNILVRSKRKALEYVAMRQEILNEYSMADDSRILVLNKYIPVHELRNMPEKLVYVICKEKPNRWLVCAVQETSSFDSLRLPFPEEWRGTSNDEFEEITQLSEVQSCHRNGFIAVAYSEEAAFKLAQLSISLGSK